MGTLRYPIPFEPVSVGYDGLALGFFVEYWGAGLCGLLTTLVT